MNGHYITVPAWLAERKERVRAIVITEPGGPEVLQVRQVPDPVPHEEEVLIRVKAFGFRAVEFEQEKIEPLLHAFAFVLFLLERVEQLVDDRLQAQHIVRQRRVVAAGRRVER